MGRKFVVPFTNQIVISSSTFSAGGDSGSLIVTNDTAHQPVALLYAGSSTTTIGNPIGEVLDTLGATLGTPVTFVGGGKKGGGGRGPSGVTSVIPEPYIPQFGGQMPELPQQALDNATRVMKGNVDNLMSLPSVIGVGVGAADENATEAVIMIYVDRTTGVRPQLPQTLDGVRLKQILTDTFTAR